MNANTANNDNLIYPDLSYKIVGMCYKIQNDLGRYCLEAQYANALEKELKLAGINYEREKYIPVKINKENVGKNWADFVIEDKIIIELKAKPFVERDDYYQARRYLKLNNLKLGLIINFQSKYLKPKRILNSQYSQKLA